MLRVSRVSQDRRRTVQLAGETYDHVIVARVSDDLGSLARTVSSKAAISLVVDLTMVVCSDTRKMGQNEDGISLRHLLRCIQAVRKLWIGR